MTDEETDFEARLVVIRISPDDNVTFHPDESVSTTELLGIAKRFLAYADGELDAELEQQTLDE